MHTAAGQANSRVLRSRVGQVLGRVRDNVSSGTPRADLAELERPALDAALAELGHPRFRARQIFGWIYRQGVTDVEAMGNLPHQLRSILRSSFDFSTPSIFSRE